MDNTTASADVQDDKTAKNFLVVENEDPDNFIPEEILMAIFIHVPIDSLLEMSLVCKTWYKVIRSSYFWCQVYKKTYRKEPSEQYPWHVFYKMLIDTDACSSEESWPTDVSEESYYSDYSYWSTGSLHLHCNDCYDYDDYWPSD